MVGGRGGKRTSQSVTTLTFKSPQFHLEHMAHRGERGKRIQEENEENEP